MNPVGMLATMHLCLSQFEKWVSDTALTANQEFCKFCSKWPSYFPTSSPNECNKLCSPCFSLVADHFVPRWIQSTDLTHILQAAPNSFGAGKGWIVIPVCLTHGVGNFHHPLPTKQWGPWNNFTENLASVHGSNGGTYRSGLYSHIGITFRL
jgi:hypothetical protein